MAEQIKQTNTNAKIIGTLEEKALELKQGIVKKGADGKEYTTDVIQGKLVVDGYEIRVYTQSHTSKGENRMFKGINTVYETFVDKVQAAKEGIEPDTIEVGVKYECNDYPSPSQAPTEIKTGVQISLFRASRVVAETEHQAEIDINQCVIRRIAPEVKNEEETGRLIVEVATFDYNGKLKPLTFFVEEDLAEDFSDMYEAGQTARLYAELKKVQVGGEDASKKKAAFGKKAQVSSGYTIIEAVIIGGEEAADEEMAYDLADVKAAMNQRDEELAAMLKEAQEKAKTKKSGGNGGLSGSAKPPKKTMGKQANVDEEDDSLPF